MAVASGKLHRTKKTFIKRFHTPVAGSQYMAAILTQWGCCGVVWRLVNSCNDRSCQDLPQSGLLSCIVTPGRSEAELRAAFPDAIEVLPDRTGSVHAGSVPSWFGELVAFLQDYYSADLRPADAPDRPAGLSLWPLWRSRLDLEMVTPFQLRVLDVVAAIPRGHIMTYGQVAQKLGAPQAARAVGAALGRNPWPVLVPCHRVIASDGQLTGFSAPGGVAAKQRMLRMEGYHNPNWRI